MSIADTVTRIPYDSRSPQRSLLRKKLHQPEKVAQGALYVGSYESLLTAETDVVISVGQHHPYVPLFVEHYHFDVSEHSERYPTMSADQLFTLMPSILCILHSMLMSNRDVAVCSLTGESRSVAVVAAYLIEHHGHKTEVEALEFIKKHHTQAKLTQACKARLLMFACDVADRCSAVVAEKQHSADVVAVVAEKQHSADVVAVVAEKQRVIAEKRREDKPSVVKHEPMQVTSWSVDEDDTDSILSVWQQAIEAKAREEKYSAYWRRNSVDSYKFRCPPGIDWQPSPPQYPLRIVETKHVFDDLSSYTTHDCSHTDDSLSVMTFDAMSSVTVSVSAVSDVDDEPPIVYG